MGEGATVGRATHSEEEGCEEGRAPRRPVVFRTGAGGLTRARRAQRRKGDIGRSNEVRKNRRREDVVLGSSMCFLGIRCF